MFKIEFSVRAREREWLRKRGSESLQVAELLNYLAMENHVSTVRGAGLNVSISARITSLCVCVYKGVCVRVFVLAKCVGLWMHFVNSSSSHLTLLSPPVSLGALLPAPFTLLRCLSLSEC